MTMMELERQRYREGMERGISQGEAKMLIKMSREFGLDDTTILQSLQDKLGISLEQAAIYLKKYTE